MEIYHPRDDELLREMRRVRRAAKRKRLIWGFVIWLLLSIAAGIILFNRFYMLSVIQGPAMADTLPAGSLVLVRRTEEGKYFSSGDIILYEKTNAVPVVINILSPKGKKRDYCRYSIYREVDSKKQYLSRKDGYVSWIADVSEADVFESDQDGNLTLDTEGMPNGEYWLKEVHASYGQEVLADPIPFDVSNSKITQIKRVIAASGDRIVLSAYQKMRVNSKSLNKAFTSGREEDVSVETRRVNTTDGQYFVLGDQLSLSVDSRDKDFDIVLQPEVLGRAEFALWPISCFGDLTGQVVTAEGTGQEDAE